MTTLPKMSLKSAISRDDVQLTPDQLGYFRGRAQSKAHSLVLQLFTDLAREDCAMTRGFLARRLGKKPEQITRWLGAPGNWTLETLSNLLLAMGYEPQFSAFPLNEIRGGNYYHPAAAGPLWPTKNAPSVVTFERLEQDQVTEHESHTLAVEG